MRKASRGAGALGVAAALALTAACGFGGDEPTQSDEDRLVDMVNESARLDAELSAAEHRIIVNCLEEQGHTVHDAYTMEQWEPQEMDSLTYEYPHESFILSKEDAAEYGFGAWADAEGSDPEESQAYYEHQEEQYEDEYDENYEEPDNSEFEALDPQEQYDWWVAYYGEEKAAEWDAYLLDENYGEEGMPEDGVATEEPGADGAIVLEDEEYVEPKPGGCELEMIEGLYGEPELVEHEGESAEESWTEWSYRPENPEYGSETMWEDIQLAYLDKIGDLPYDFSDCLAERGHEGWEIGEGGYVPTWEYFYQIYWDESQEDMYGDMEGYEAPELPPLPDDLPSSYEDKKAYEIEVAIAFAECGEELDYATKSTEAYDQVHIDAYTAIEEDVFAWQEEMRDAIEKAQEMIGS